MHTESGAEKQTTIAMGWQAARETMPPVPRKTYDKGSVKNKNGVQQSRRCVSTNGHAAKRFVFMKLVGGKCPTCL